MSSGDNIRVLIADDHAIVREGLSMLLTTQPDISIVGEAVDGPSTVERFRELKPDVLLLDLLMPGMDGVEVLEAVRGETPDARVIVLTGVDDEEYLGRAIQAGAEGYLIKDAASGQILDAIRAVYRGEGWLEPRLAGALFRKIAGRDSEDEKKLRSLTEREMEVLRLLGQAKSNAVIAKELFISEHTVKVHVSHILDKLKLKSRTEAMLFAIKMGLARP